MPEKILELDNIDIKIEMGSLLLNVLYLRFAPPARIKHIGNHCHSSYELHYIPYGKGELITGGHIYAITPGTLYLTGPNIYHEQRGDMEDPMAEYCINFEILERNSSKPKKGQYLGEDIKTIEKTLFNTAFWFGKDHYNNISLFDKLMEEINEKHIGYYSNIKNYVNIIITNTVRCYSSNQISPDTPPTKDVTDKRRLITDQYIENKWNTRTTDELADKLGVSIRQLNRIFVKYYGMSFNEKLTHVRMQNAAKHLTESNLSIKAIAELVGIDDFGYFCRLFKKHFSMTALEYRKSYRQY